MAYRCALCGAREVTEGSDYDVIVGRAAAHLMTEHGVDPAAYRPESIRRELWFVLQQ